MGTDKRERQKANRQMARIEAEKRAKAAKRKRNIIRWGAIGLAAAVAIILLSVLTKKDKSPAADATSTTVAGATTTAASTATTASPNIVPAADGAAITGDTPCPAADGTSARTTSFAKAPPMCIDATKAYKAVVDTNLGSYTITLDAKNAPKTVNNYVVLARYHYFDASPCHRIIGKFMAQCGDPSGTGTGNGGKLPGYTVEDENVPTGNVYKAGDVAMANTGAPNSGGSQYFTLFADWTAPAGGGYALFGHVTDGLDTTVKALEAAADPAAANGTPPKQPVTINKVTITET